MYTVVTSVVIPSNACSRDWVCTFSQPKRVSVTYRGAQVHGYVRRDRPKSLLHFQEPPLELDGEETSRSGHPSCMMVAVTPSVVVSQYADIYIVFPLGCSQGAQGGWSPGAVTGREVGVGGVGGSIPFTCEASVAEPLSGEDCGQ